MAKHFILFFILCGIVYSQQDSCIDTINLKGNWLIGYQFKFSCWDYEKAQKLLSLNENLTGILSSDSLSAKFSKPAISIYNIGILFDIAGSAMLGYNLGLALTGNTVSSRNWAICLSLFAIDIPLELKGLSLLRKSIDQYNKGTKKTP